MKRYFLDTNILIDFIANRKPFGQHALALFEKAIEEEWELWTSDNSITTTYYIIEREVGTVVAKEKLAILLKYLEVQPVGKEDLLSALQSGFKDYEDAVQYAAASRITRLTAIVTRNKKDFRGSLLPVLSADELLVLY